jgi:hypothetical protein
MSTFVQVYGSIERVDWDRAIFGVYHHHHTVDIHRLSSFFAFFQYNSEKLVQLDIELNVRGQLCFVCWLDCMFPGMSVCSHELFSYNQHTVVVNHICTGV